MGITALIQRKGHFPEGRKGREYAPFPFSIKRTGYIPPVSDVSFDNNIPLVTT